MAIQVDVAASTDPVAPWPHLVDQDFAALGLSPDSVASAAAAGWTQPTAIQRRCIPAVLAGQDVLGLAPTGSGKTAAFLLPLLQAVQANAGLLAQRPRRLQALILSPTRELAAQTHQSAAALAPALKTVLAVGGLSINPQMLALRGGADVVVATPGRLLDLLAHHALRLDGLRTLVLDEADRLLDLGFADEVGRLLAQIPSQTSSQTSSQTPARRQTLMFTATLPDDVQQLVGQLLHNAVTVDVRPVLEGPATLASSSATSLANPSPAITQRAIEVDTALRTPLLRQLMLREGWRNVLVFTATQYATELVAHKLQLAGVSAAALHGQLSPGRRAEVLADFKAGRLAVLVATDLAARGLDVVALAAVVNHDLPRSAVDYTHRIGRTGRAGQHGVAVSFICADAPGSEAHFRLIEKRQRQRVPRERVAGFEPAALLPAALLTDPHGGVKGRRKSKKDKLREAAARSV